MMSKRARLREIWNHRRKDIKTATAAERRKTPEKERTYIEKKLQENLMIPDDSAYEGRLREHAVAELAETVFAFCGPLAWQLGKDVESMKLSEGWMNEGWCLPYSFGYSEGEYFAAEPMDRSNDWLYEFRGSDGEAFRWYLLKRIAERCAQQWELELRKKLQKKWMYADTSSEKPNENAYYRAVYDSRREWMETALKLLTAVYGYHGEPMQKYAKNCVSLLNRRGVDRAELRWEPAPDRPEFIAMEWDMETE